jgi:phasin family protein
MINETNPGYAAETSGPDAASIAAACVKQTLTDLWDGMAKASAGFEQTQAKLVKSTETAMTKAVEIVGGNLNALTRSGQIWVAGVNDLSKQVAASVQASFQETAGAVRALAAVKSLQEAIDLQSGFARGSLGKAMAESDRFARASLKLTEQAMAPVTERVRIAGETFAKAL